MSVRPRPTARHGLTRPGTGQRKTAATAPPSRQPIAGPSPATSADSDITAEPLLYTADQAAELLQVRPSWLRRKAAARAVPCRYVGKHLRFSRADINAIAEASAQAPHQRRRTP